MKSIIRMNADMQKCMNYTSWVREMNKGSQIIACVHVWREHMRVLAVCACAGVCVDDHSCERVGT